MKKKKYPHYLPEGWTLEKVREIADYYDRQSDAEGAAEIDTAEEAETLMVIPPELVPQVRKLIAENGRKKAKSAKAKRVA